MLQSPIHGRQVRLLKASVQTNFMATGRQPCPTGHIRRVNFNRSVAGRADLLSKACTCSSLAEKKSSLGVFLHASELFSLQSSQRQPLPVHVCPLTGTAPDTAQSSPDTAANTSLSGFLTWPRKAFASPVLPGEASRPLLLLQLTSGCSASPVCTGKRVGHVPVVRLALSKTYAKKSTWTWRTWSTAQTGTPEESPGKKPTGGDGMRRQRSEATKEGRRRQREDERKGRRGHRRGRAKKRKRERRGEDGSPPAEEERGPSQGRSSRRRCGVLCRSSQGSGHGSAHSSESGSSQARNQSSVSGKGGASLVATRPTRRKMARAESRWSDDELH